MPNIPLSVKVPDMVNISEPELMLLLATKLYETQKLSLGQAADVAGLSKRAFVEILGKYGVSVFLLTAEELQRDMANA